MHDQITDLLKAAGLSDREAAAPSALTSEQGSNTQNSATLQAIHEATQSINELQVATQSNVDLMSSAADSSPQAVQASGSSNAASSVENFASGFLGGGSGLGGGLLGGGLGLLFDGIASLFGGGASEPPPLTKYVAPSSQNFELATSNGTTGSAVYDSTGDPREVDVAQSAISGIATPGNNGPSGTGGSTGANPNSGAGGPQITVQVQAMDSQSFMDRSGDIAAAVRHAMLNMHSVNDVINDL